MATYLNKTLGTATNTKKFTIAVWCKLNNLSSNNYIMAAGTNNNDYIDDLRILSNGQLVFDGYVTGSTYRLKTERQLRDPLAWYHIVVRYDSTQSTSSERLKMYINGLGETDFETATYPSLNYDPQFNKNVEHMVGRNLGGSNYWQGYLAQLIFIDGTAYDPSPFGSTNSDGVWIPNTSPSVTYGNNGFKLDFTDSGASAATGNFGSDSSGNNNHFTSNSLGTNPNTKDTPTNNFATLNMLASTNTISEGALKAVTKSSKRVGSMSSLGMSSGKWYAEYKIVDATGSACIGIENDAGVSFYNFDENVDWWNNSNAYAYQNDGNKRTTGVNASYGASFTAGDIIGVALDMDNRKLYFSKNGTFQDSGNPASGSTGTGAAFTVTDGLTYFFQFADQSTVATSTFQANFGNPTFTIASGNADANGYGNFEYAVPSGYYALCTKNLAQYG